MNCIFPIVDEFDAVRPQFQGRDGLEGTEAARVVQGDIVSKETRSRMMRAVRQRGTKPERVIGDLLRELGVRYRLNVRSLPGSPDFANQTRGWVVFVNGCFWHGHRNCPKTKGGRSSRIPSTRRKFWSDKIRANRRRDACKCREIRSLGLRVLIVWECQVPDLRRMKRKLSRFLRED